MVKYFVAVEWKNLSLMKGSHKEPLDHKQLDAFLHGLDYGVAHGKPDKVTVTAVLEETEETTKT